MSNLEIRIKLLSKWGSHFHQQGRHMKACQLRKSLFGNKKEKESFAFSCERKRRDVIEFLNWTPSPRWERQHFLCVLECVRSLWPRISRKACRAPEWTVFVPLCSIGEVRAGSGSPKIGFSQLVCCTHHHPTCLACVIYLWEPFRSWWMRTSIRSKLTDIDVAMVDLEALWIVDLRSRFHGFGFVLCLR